MQKLCLPWTSRPKLVNGSGLGRWCQVGFGLLTLWVGATVAKGESAYFLDVPGFPGTSVVEGYANEFNAQSFTWGLSPGTVYRDGGGGSLVKVKFSDVSVVIPVTASFPGLVQACAKGTPIAGDVVLHVTRSNGDGYVEYMTLDLIGAKIAAIKTSGDDTNPVLTVSFSYQKIVWSYDDQVNAPITGGWDLRNNKPYTPPPAPPT